MPAWKTLEAIVEFRAVRLPASGRRKEQVELRQLGPKSPQRILLDCRRVEVTSRKEVWARSSDQFLDALSEQKRCGQTKAQPQPSRVPFPQLPSQYGSFGGILPNVKPGRQDESRQGRDDTRRNEGNNDERCSGDFFMFNKRKGYVRIDG